MNADTRVVRLGPGDEERARRVLPALKSPDAAAQAAEALLADRGCLLFAAWYGEDPVGFLLAYVLPRAETVRPMLFLYELEVHAAYRRRGIGRALMDAFLAEGAARNCLKAFVLTNESNAAAARLYESAGGVRSGERDEALYEFHPSGRRR